MAAGLCVRVSVCVERSPRRPLQLEEIKGEHVLFKYHTDIPAYGEEIEGADLDCEHRSAAG